MKKIFITLIALLFLATFGCNKDENKDNKEKTGQTTMETQDKTAAANKGAVVEPENKTGQTTNEAVQKPKKKPTVEGC